MFTPQFTGMGLAAVKMNVAQYPLAIGFLGSIRIVIVAKDLLHLIHQLQLRVWSKAEFIFHNISLIWE